MSCLAPTLQAFFTERLINQRQASANVAAYRDTCGCCCASCTTAPASRPASWTWAT